MANNGGGGGGRQGGGGGGGNGGNQMNEHVEFTVKAEEDLFLTGTENTIRRVTAETNYSCLMLKTQRFSSLFRHYAKYHGLRKDDLEYYFVNPLENEDTPESVHLQRGDTIMVRKRRKPEMPEASADDGEFVRDMRELLDDEEHMDCVFYVYDGGGTSGTGSKQKSAGVSAAQTPFHATPSSSGAKRSVTETYSDDAAMADAVEVKKEEDDEDLDGGNLVEIRAHRCVLTARAEYFKALFRKGTSASSGGGPVVGAFRESSDCAVRVEPAFPARIVRLMLEFRVSAAQTPFHATPSSSGAKRSVTETYSDDAAMADAVEVKKEEDDEDLDGGNLVEIRAHRCVLTARAEYFKALFRKGTSASSGGGPVVGAFRESSDCAVRVEPAFPARIVRLMLEFLYTNRIQSLSSSPGGGGASKESGISTDDLLCLLHLSDKWLLRDLKRLCEHELIRSHMSTNTVARMYCATEDYRADRLSKACIEFIMENIREVTGNVAFQEEMRHYPHLCIPILKAAADMIPEPAHKKQRTGDHGSS
eukprot:CAMPEP_0197464576 /NCGR_PEP_ID=MMETSP1175-20131217/64094_1 /TAXON_ID=1003142 /ORGANISM="Triceratium dubium, Strain CCMP147" /LENGTH=532 /DNA_ID=CAMNT_0043000557 /DNA_START=75 /DNA_END=1671 /DNA_ORIENTATION=-